jgi:preprotein translocase subunit SecF
MMARLGEIPGRLYRGEISVSIVRRQKMWYTISGFILVISIIALAVRGLNFSVEFKGGSVFQFPASSASATVQGDIARTVSAAGGNSVTVQHISNLKQSLWQVQTGVLSSAHSNAVETALEKAFHITPSAMAVQLVGPTWGGQITDKALEALIIFLIVMVIYLSIAFEWKMAVAAFVALLHDIVITVGVYALVGFSVSPTTVIGLLTILGYALYDTVVVFDKVRENTAGLLTSQRSSYSDAANLALNQTLVRSLNTSFTALVPVASILFIGSALVSTSTLNDLSLVLFVGMLSGTYASLCIATPVLAGLKEREPRYKDLAARVERRLAGGRAAQRAAARAEAEATRAGTTRAGTTRVGTTRADATRASAVPAVIGGTDADDADDEVADLPPSVTLAEEPAADDEVPVSAGSGSGSPAPRRVVRQQQPRRGGSAQRRPGAKKKRR